MNEPEIFSDHIDDDKKSPECNKSLSRMNKSELYELSKRLVKENMRLQLFVNSTDELHTQNEKTIKELKKDNKLKDEIISLHEQGLSLDDEEVQKLVQENEKLKEDSSGETVERIEFLEKQYMKLKEENKELKEKDKKSKEIFKELVEWYESCKNDSEEEDEDE